MAPTDYIEELMINVRLLEAYAGLSGARTLWQQLITQLVSLQYGDNARSIQPAPGDWGIDVIVGSLASGPCTIWQAKYYPEVIGNTQKNDIIDSFKTLEKKSSEKGFTVDQWFLCIPTVLTGRMELWWDKWRSEQIRETNIQIGLWHKDYIEKLLIDPKAKYISDAFGLDGAKIPLMVNARVIIPLPPAKHEEYENALFIKKLVHAGITDNSSARSQFFNAELLREEVRARGDPVEQSELDGVYENILSYWENLFNQAKFSNHPEDEMRKVYFKMNDLLLALDKSDLFCPKTAATCFHKKGCMHQLAELCKVGWTLDYKSLSEGS